MVKNLLIIRHCEASFNSETNRDFDRPLTNKGFNQATVLGQWIESLPFELDAFYVSPALRTMQTLRGVREELSVKPRIMDGEEIYEATENVLKAAVNRFDNLFSSVALVGHNPSVAQLFAYLTFDIRDYVPGTCAWLQCNVDDWAALSQNSAELKDFYYPGMDK